MEEPKALKCDVYLTSTVPPAELVVRASADPADVVRQDLLQLLGDLQPAGTRELVFGRERDTKALVEVLGQQYHIS